MTEQIRLVPERVDAFEWLEVIPVNPAASSSTRSRKLLERPEKDAGSVSTLPAMGST